MYTNDYLLGRCGYVHVGGATVIERHDYHYQGGNSNKVYIGVVIKDPQFSTKYFCLYGGYMKNLTSQAYNQVTWQAKLDEKMNKGYQSTQLPGWEVPGGTSTPSPVPPKAAPAKPKPEWPRVIWPMGAAAPPKKDEDLQTLLNDPDVVIEYKYRGVRVTLHVPPKLSNNSRFFGRNPVDVNGEQLPNEFTDNLSHFKDLFKKWPIDLDDTILDGEILSTRYGHGVGSDAKISGDLNSKDGRDNSHLYFTAFDILFLNGEDLRSKNWEDRRILLEAVCGRLLATGIEIKASYYQETNKEDFYNKVISSGAEGAIFKHKKKPYTRGKPKGVWTKWKKVEPDDVVIMGYTYAEPGKYNNGIDIQIGAIEYGKYVECSIDVYTKYMQGNHLQAIPTVGEAYMFIQQKDSGTLLQLTYQGKCSGITDSVRREFTDNGNKYLGQVMKIHKHDTAADTGTNNLARFIAMHEDKSPYLCIHNGQIKAKRATAAKRKKTNVETTSTKEATA